MTSFSLPCATKPSLEGKNLLIENLFSYKDHANNENVHRKIQASIGEYDVHRPTMVKHITHTHTANSGGLATY